jgi:hypothetical protein
MSPGNWLRPGVRCVRPLSRACGQDAAFMPIPTPPAPTGRPPRHGHKLACADPTTWPEPNQEYTTEDTKVRSGAGARLAPPACHPTQSSQAGTRGPRPLMRGTRILVEVERLPKRTRLPKQLWLWWHGPEPAFLVLRVACLCWPLQTGAYLSLRQTVPRA